MSYLRHVFYIGTNYLLCLFVLLFLRHEAALWRSDRQHLSGEDHQPGQAYRDLQPGRSESRQGSVITQSGPWIIIIIFNLCNKSQLSDTTFLLNIDNWLPIGWNHCTVRGYSDSGEFVVESQIKNKELIKVNTLQS